MITSVNIDVVLKNREGLEVPETRLYETIEIYIHGVYDDVNHIDENYFLGEEAQRDIKNVLRNTINRLKRMSTPVSVILRGDNVNFDLGNVGSLIYLSRSIEFHDLTLSIPKFFESRNLITFRGCKLKLVKSKPTIFNEINFTNTTIEGDNSVMQVEKITGSGLNLPKSIEIVGKDKRTSELTISNVSTNVDVSSRYSHLVFKNFKFVSLSDVNVIRTEKRPVFAFRNSHEVNLSNVDIYESGGSTSVDVISKFNTCSFISVDTIVSHNDGAVYDNGYFIITNAYDVSFYGVNTNGSEGVLIKSIRFKDKLLPKINVSDSKVDVLLDCSPPADDTPNTINSLSVSNSSLNGFGRNIKASGDISFSKMKIWKSRRDINLTTNGRISLSNSMIVADLVSMFLSCKTFHVSRSQLALDKLECENGTIMFSNTKNRIKFLKAEYLSLRGGSSNISSYEVEELVGEPQKKFIQ